MREKLHFLVNLFTFFNSLQDGLFGGAHRWEGGGGANLNLSHIAYNDETWHSYTLPMEDLKNI